MECEHLFVVARANCYCRFVLLLFVCVCMYVCMFAFVDMYIVVSTRASTMSLFAQ